MSLDVTTSVRIDAPPAAVAAVQFDPAPDPDWIGGVDRVERSDPRRDRPRHPSARIGAIARLIRCGSDDTLGCCEDGLPGPAHVVDALAMLQDGGHDLRLGTDDLPAAGAPDTQVLAGIGLLHGFLLHRALHPSDRKGSGT